MPTLPEKVLLLEEGLRQRRIPHAFGGAIALAYYATPRATIDIDLNVFVPVERADAVLSLLEALGAGPLAPDERARLERQEQARVLWGGTPVDLFFSYDPLHESCLERRRLVPFGDGDAIHVLSAEDLLVFKALFDRDKDRRDIAELVYAMAEELDAAYARRWLERIVGADDPRYRRLEEALEG
jgi:Nucleotidyl transferase AbiEii toxin, Type IV TA system